MIAADPTWVAAIRGIATDLALHESAHAVVMMRLGVPLVSTEITRREWTSEDVGAEAMFGPFLAREKRYTAGYTSVDPDEQRSWVEALPDPEARRSLEAYAAGIGAGPWFEKGVLGQPAWSQYSEGDLRILGVLASHLRIAKSHGEAAHFAWVNDRVNTAGRILIEREEAWLRVATFLDRRGILTGDEVRAIIRGADNDVRFMRRSLRRKGT